MLNYPIVSIAIGATAAYILATLIATLLARMGFPLPPAERRIGCIDGLRGYLALSVLIGHFIRWIQITRLGETWSTPAPVHVFNQLGSGAVMLFFMITGLVFYPRILDGYRACSWPKIYISRVFRIIPLVTVSVAAVTLFISIKTGHRPDSSFPKAAAEWILALGEPDLLGYPDSWRLNAGVLWSLWYEWLFYLLLLPASAVAADLVRGRLPSWVLPAVLLLAGLSLQAFHLANLFLPFFAMGMLAYECQSREAIVRWLRTPLATMVAAGSLGIVMFFPTRYGLGAILFGIFFACIACGNSMWGLFKTRAALVLGECSFGIYLIHGILLALIFDKVSGLAEPLSIDLLPILLLAPAAACVALITAISYLLIERPSIHLGSRIANHWKGVWLRPLRPPHRLRPSGRAGSN
ncbi:acyltransferase [Methylocystis sp. IM3]|uniref:acyltransferase family protein n=1 Tax=Methylocystis sp. IM3 TaxID=3136722 RepID=UPI00311A3676